MRTSETIVEISKSLIKVQAEIQNPPKTKINPHFKNSYVDLSDGLDMVRKILVKHDIVLIQGADVTPNGDMVLDTRLLHKSGEWIESTYLVTHAQTAQQMGSSMTYARRYALFPMLGIAGEDDDDGNAAQEGHVPARSGAKAPAAKAKANGKMATPGFSPDDSSKVKAGYMLLLDTVESKEHLDDATSQIQEEINNLLPEHQAELRAKFKEVKAKYYA